MTVTTTTGKISYAGDDSTATFATGFKFLENGHIKVTLRDSSDVETEWTEGTQYTLTGAGDADGGNVVVATTPTNYTPATGETLIIELDVPFTQATALPLAGQLPSTELEKSIDKLTLLATQLNELFDRTLRAPTSDTQEGDNLVMPIDADRASKFLGFDANGKPIAAAGTSADLGPVTAFIDTLLDDATAADARTTLGAIAASDTIDFTGTVSFSDNSVQIISTDAGASEGPGLDLFRNSASPAAADVGGALRWKFDDSAGNETSVAKFVATLDDPTNGSEDAHITLTTIVAGVFADRFHFGGGIYADGLTDPGTGKIDADDLLIAGASIPFQKSYTSAEQTIATAGALTLAHGLAAAPELVQCRLKCLTGEHGFTVGQEVPVQPGADQDGTSRGMSMILDATNITIRFANAGPFPIINATTGAIATITPANWSLIVRAWA